MTTTPPGVPHAAVTRPAALPAASLPAALVGEWSGDDDGGIGSWTLAFAEDGSYRMSNERRRVSFEGRAAAQGSQLLLQPASGSPSAVAWAVDGGRLTLDGSVYLRTDAGSGADGSALVGSWLSTSDTYKTLTMAPDGTFRLDNPAGTSSAGTWSVDGSRISFSRSGQPRVDYDWTVEDGFLRLRRDDGTVSEYTRGG